MKILSKYNKALFLLFAIAFGGLFFSQNSTAISATDFKAGRIIDDAVFYNKNTMGVSDIQAFLDKQIGSCDVWGAKPASDWGRPDITRAQYALQTWGKNPPFVCLNKYHENPNTKETSFEKGGGWFEGGISAAQIIYDAAQKYNINPQVLLVLLKKESPGPLTNDSWPLKSQYRYAMGYACPDSGPNFSAACSESKSGFYNQMTLAAWQLNYYRQNSNSYNYKIGLNQIQYSPDLACGTKTVNIENVATLSLYIYTPYTPNDGALANYPRTAHCGAYGNRNFFMFFNEWFGSTYSNIFQPMWQPRQLKTTSEVNLYDATTGEVVDTRPKGLIVNFVDKAVLKNGKECLRSDASRDTQKNNCILFEELEETKIDR